MYILRGERNDAFSIGILALRVLTIDHVPNRRTIRTVWVKEIIQVKDTPFLCLESRFRATVDLPANIKLAKECERLKFAVNELNLGRRL